MSFNLTPSEDDCFACRTPLTFEEKADPPAKLDEGVLVCRACVDAGVVERGLAMGRVIEEQVMKFTEIQLIEACARSAHEANRAYCLTLGDDSQKPWDHADPQIRESARSGVKLALGGATPEQQHESWRSFKQKDGWIHGTTKDPVKKTHPCMVEYGQLPTHQRAKDTLYQAAVRAMSAALREVELSGEDPTSGA